MVFHENPVTGGFKLSRKPRVIAIAAVSGGGKTTATMQLADKLSNSKALYFDDYEFEDCPDDICEWVEQGADYETWQLNPLIEDVRSLLIESFDYILLDYPFAYLNSGMRDFIDLSIYIDTPLDVAMARRILRDYAQNPIEDVRKDLTHYLSRARPAFLEMERSVKPNSDIIIDGSQSTAMIVERILQELKNKGLY